jgi:hypothetical protein
MNRRGSVLILISGIASILVTMTLAFLMRMRSDLEESRAVMQDVQARGMLTAALMYVSETARMGWDGATAGHRETYGWIDVRDGKPGPRYRDGTPADGYVADDAFGNGAVFPAPGGKAARCPMYRMQRPRYAILPIAVPNPIGTDPSRSWAGLIDYAKPDPQPVSYDPAVFAGIDATPVANTLGLSWFRVYRRKITAVDRRPSVFILSCGAGGTDGFRSFAEAVAEGEGDRYGTQQAFDDLRVAERILWYEAEWNPAVSQNVTFHYTASNSYQIANINRTGPWQCSNVQFGGTFLYIQRLMEAPPDW